MRNALKRIRAANTQMFILEGRTGYPSMTARRRLTAEHSIEKSGRSVARHDAWLKQVVDQTVTNKIASGKA
jgi:ketol-acid reductoisomerase